MERIEYLLLVHFRGSVVNYDVDGAHYITFPQTLAVHLYLVRWVSKARAHSKIIEENPCRVCPQTRQSM